MVAIIYYLLLLLSIPVAIYFFVLFVIAKQRTCLITALLWLLPLPYEAIILSTCTGECNIRVDLLIVFPLELIVLIPMSTAAYRGYAESKRGSRES